MERHRRREVRLADDRDAVADDRLAGLGQGAVAAGLGGEVDDDRAGPHAGDCVLRDEDRCGPAGDERRRDHGVRLLHVEGHELPLALLLVLGERDRVAADALAPSTSSSRKVAPRLSTCSFTTGRTS